MVKEVVDLLYKKVYLMQVVLRANETHMIISRANIDDDK
jgi:hypothetical protein